VPNSAPSGPSSSRSPTACSAAPATPRTWSRSPGCDMPAQPSQSAMCAHGCFEPSAALAWSELRSARARRERYVGPWLPEPVLTGEGAAQDPLAQVEREVLSLGALRLLERLTPAGRWACRMRRSPPPSVSAAPVPRSIWPGLGATLPPSRHSRRSRQRSTGARSPPCGQRSRPATQER
jgi:hypothetical protein